MTVALQILEERGFIAQTTGKEALGALLDRPGALFYVGFDPTADSLHAGSLMPIMAMAHLQRAGHRPIAIIGGGTTMIGDPSGKTELRRMMSAQEIEANGAAILGQLKRYLKFGEGSGLFLDNAEWLLPLNYIEFLRDIGRHFRVNEMLRAESYRQRLERQEGLTFIEFNYQLLQAYDFLVLFRRHGCRLQMGGDDQWGNILAGTELIRRIEGEDAHGLTFPLLTTARGQKMGKTETGAVWLTADRTSPYEFYQYWINTDDRDVERFLAFFTFLPMAEVRALGALQGEELREAKERLALEATALAHGADEAEKARAASRAAFGGGEQDLDAMPTSEVQLTAIENGMPLVDLFCQTGLAQSKSQARRLIQQGGAYLNDQAVSDVNHLVHRTDFKDGAALLRSGKKKYHRVLLR